MPPGGPITPAGPLSPLSPRGPAGPEGPVLPGGPYQKILISIHTSPRHFKSFKLTGIPGPPPPDVFFVLGRLGIVQLSLFTPPPLPTWAGVGPWAAGLWAGPWATGVVVLFLLAFGPF